MNNYKPNKKPLLLFYNNRYINNSRLRTNHELFLIDSEIKTNAIVIILIFSTNFITMIENT